MWRGMFYSADKIESYSPKHSVSGHSEVLLSRSDGRNWDMEETWNKVQVIRNIKRLLLSERKTWYLKLRNISFVSWNGEMQASGTTEFIPLIYIPAT